MSLFQPRRLALSLALALLSPPMAFARPALPLARDAPPTAEKTVSADVSAADLHAVVAMLGRQAAVTVLVRDGDQPYKPVYVHLDGASLSKALQTVAVCAGAQVTRNGDGVYVFSPLLTSPPLPRAVPETPAVGYRWHTLVLQHAVPSDILALMHWNTAAAPPSALPTGVHRIFALQSTTSLLVEATDEGFATVAQLVKILDIAPRSVGFQMELVAVPAARAALYAPDMPASWLLPLLLAGESRMISIPTETVTDGHSTFVSADVPVITLPASRFRLVRVGPRPGRHGLSALYAFRLTPRINADGTITLGLEFATTAPLAMRSSTPRTLRAGELVVYDVTGPSQTVGQRLFLFLLPTIMGEIEAARDGDGSVTVTP